MAERFPELSPLLLETSFSNKQAPWRQQGRAGSSSPSRAGSLSVSRAGSITQPNRYVSAKKLDGYTQLHSLKKASDALSLPKLFCHNAKRAQTPCCRNLSLSLSNWPQIAASPLDAGSPAAQTCGMNSTGGAFQVGGQELHYKNWLAYNQLQCKRGQCLECDCKWKCEECVAAQSKHAALSFAVGTDKMLRTTLHCQLSKRRRVMLQPWRGE